MKSRWPTTSSSSRGYGAAWRKLRLEILERDGYLCQCTECKTRKPMPRRADQVNHKVPKAEAERRGWTPAQIDHPSNLESLNEDCHDRITIQQKGHTPHPPRPIGLDGFPIEAPEKR